MKNENMFRSWLEAKTDLGLRSRSDVVSRAKRVAELVDVEKDIAKDELDIMINRHPEVRTMTSAVRSQLKRAAGLYRQFIGISKT